MSEPEQRTLLFPPSLPAPSVSPEALSYQIMTLNQELAHLRQVLASHYSQITTHQNQITAQAAQISAQQSQIGTLNKQVQLLLEREVQRDQNIPSRSRARRCVAKRAKPQPSVVMHKQQELKFITYQFSATPAD